MRSGSPILRPAVFNRLMYVVFVGGILGIALLTPFLQSVSVTGNLTNASNMSGLASPVILPTTTDTPFVPVSSTYQAPEDLPPEALPQPYQNPTIPPDLEPNLTGSMNPGSSAVPAPAFQPGQLPTDLKPLGTRYQYRDNERRQIVTMSVRNFMVADMYSYHYIDQYIPDIITVDAAPGNNFIFVGVTWELTDVLGEGSRTTFLTPSVSSYTLWYNGVSYAAVDPDTITDILQDAIIGVGVLANEESIDKDNPGDGFLIFQVPKTTSAMESYLQFCPVNTDLAEPHSPPWDCPADAIRWSLV